MPKLRKQTFESAIIERYRRREASIEESLIKMYLAGVSVRRVEDITQALWGTRVPHNAYYTLAGVTPGASKTNRNVKGSLETAILARAKKQTHTYLLQGPIWYGTEPIHGKL